MESFYDEQLPNKLRKIVKPYGGTVERTPLAGDSIDEIEQAMEDVYEQGFPEAETRAQLDVLRTRMKLAEDNAHAWVIKMTPELRKKILQSGLPLMTGIGAVGLAATDASAQTPKTAKTDEAAFQRWYATMATQHDLSPNPEGQFYDYRAAFRAHVTPNADGHWPSKYKLAGHPNEVVGGFNTRTGRRVPGTPRMSEAELINAGWAPATAKRLAQQPD
jgi:hypothetical protein